MMNSMNLFEGKEVYSSGEKKFSISKEKFFTINGLWFVIMEGDPLSEKIYNHVALKVSNIDFEKYAERVRSLGLEILEEIKKRNMSTQVVMLTADDSVETSVKAMKLGAVDYLVKPFVFGELLARVRAIVRRRYGERNPLIRVADLEINTTL